MRGAQTPSQNELFACFGKQPHPIRLDLGGNQIGPPPRSNRIGSRFDYTTVLLFLLPGPSGAIEANSLRDLPSPPSIASPQPSVVRASAFGPLCTSPCSSDVPRRKVGAWEFGRAQLGAVLLGPMCAALSSDVPTERWGVGVRAHNGTVCCPFACCSARCAPPELGRAPPTGGAVGVRVHSGAICFAPCVVHPPPSCARSSRASGRPLRTRGGPSHQLSAPLSSPPCIHIYVHPP